MAVSTLSLGSDPEVVTAFNSLIEGLRQGRHKDELCSHCEILEAAWDRALQTPEGVRYLEGHPGLKLELELRRGKSDLKSELPTRLLRASCTGPDTADPQT
jgi:hypothetical protein